MRKVIYAPMVSLDGFVEGPNHELDWGRVDEELHTYINARQSQLDTYLFGRGTYEVMKYWDTAGADPSNPAYMLEYARIWRGITKIVFSQTLEHVQGKATLSRGDIVETIAQLKTQPGKDMGLGGATIAAPLIRLGLIDEYQLFIHPVVLGSGTRLFPALTNTLNLQLIETHRFNSGAVFLRYQPADQAP